MDMHYESETVTTDNNSSCITESNQHIRVSLPVKIDAYAQVEGAKVCCYNDPVITVRPICGCGCCDCDCKYELVITQEINIILPIRYSADVRSGVAEANCSNYHPCCN